MKPKNIIPGLLIAITVFFFSRGCEKIAKPKDYKDFAEDYCTCFNESTASISEEAKQIFINSDPSNPEKMAMAYLTGEITEEDLEKIENAETCIDELMENYGDLKTRDSEEEVIRKMLDAMDQNAKCEFTLAITRIGLEAQNNPDFN